MKRCPKCEQTKPLDSFCSDRSKGSGKSVYCKACIGVSNRERYKAYHLTERYKARRRESQKKYHSENQEKANAHRLARSVPLADICEDCGVKPAVHRHHPDYSKPLEVLGLCVRCHENAHHGVIA